MAVTLSSPTTRGLLGGLVVGLLVGLAIGYLVGRGGTTGSTWADAGAAWTRLPEQTALGAPPQTFTVPAQSYDYGGVTQPLSPAILDTPSIVRVDLKAETGRVGISLARPDGGKILSKEAVIAPALGKTSVYFRTGPGLAPAVLLLRNYDNTGAAGSVTVYKVQVAPEGQLGKGDLERINKAGVN